MRKLLNTLYITSEDAYLALEGETIAVKRDEMPTVRFPLINLESIVTFNYVGVSPALLRKCTEKCISISFFLGDKYCGHFIGEENGNVLLRKQQYRFSDSSYESAKIAKNMVIGKIFNERYVIERTLRDHSLQIDVELLNTISDSLKDIISTIKNISDLDMLRGYEGMAANLYFSVFNEMIFNDKEHFVFSERNRRPPLDRVNAMLSFSYSLLASECTAALNSVGLDPYVGFLHRDRPGRKSLALDLMEEFRSPIADRFVLNLINRKEIRKEDFDFTESGAVLLTEFSRKKFIKEWHENRKEEIMHPFLKEKISVGLLPFVQAMLLARYIRGDLNQYPPFFKR